MGTVQQVEAALLKIVEARGLLRYYMIAVWLPAFQYPLGAVIHHQSA